MPRRLTDKAMWYADQLRYGAVQSVIVTPKNERALAQLVATRLYVELRNGATRYVMTAKRAAEVA